MKNDDLPKILKDLCDSLKTALEEKESYKDRVKRIADVQGEEFFKQVDKRVAACESDLEKTFVIHVVTHFLCQVLFTLLEKEKYNGNLEKDFDKKMMKMFRRRFDRMLNKDDE